MFQRPASQFPDRYSRAYQQGPGVVIAPKRLAPVLQPG